MKRTEITKYKEITSNNTKRSTIHRNKSHKDECENGTPMNNIYEILSDINQSDINLEETYEHSIQNDINAGPPKGILKTAGINKGDHITKKVRFKKVRKRATRKLKGKKRNNKIRILYANVNGIGDKCESLLTAAQAYDAHLIAITETKQIPPKIEGYGKWISKERKNRGGGGVAITVKDEIYPKISKIEDIEDDEMDVVWVELRKNQKEKIHIGVYYGKQENAKREEVENEFELLNSHINMLKNKGEVIIMGDFNAKLNIEENNVKQQMSANGKHLKNLIDMNKLETVTIKPDTTKWTRQNRNNTEEKSVIDYIITTPKTAMTTTETIVDEEGAYRIKGNKESDHNTLLMEFNLNIPKEKRKIKRWKINNKEGWHKYNQMLEEKCNNMKPNSQEELQEIMKDVMKQTIGQRTITIGNNKIKETEKAKDLRQKRKTAKKEYENAIKNNKGKIKETLHQYKMAQKELREELEKINRERIKNKLTKLAKEGHSNQQTIWKLKAETENKKSNEQYDTITEDDNIILEPEAAKEHIAQYFENLYQARPAKPEYQESTDEITKEVEEIENYMKEQPDIEDFNEEELTKAIKKLRRKKATGPDEIPNEAFIEANITTKTIYLQQMNALNKTKEIPSAWQEGEICRLYKGKGKKGKCSNERGITLSSNFGKLYERMINERVLPQIDMTEAQAGGRRGSATVDHILVAKELIAAAKREKKNAHLAYLDVTKAYDKAWLTGIMHVLYKQGLQDNHWTIVKKLNENLTAKLQTKHGLTREIKIRDSIRQGGVLSTTLYGLLMDEISKELTKANIGIKIEGLTNKIGSLLWVDDVYLITLSGNELQESLNITNETSNKYHIEYGASKSNSLLIKHSKKKEEEYKHHIGEMEIKQTEKYKYLGLLQNQKNNNDDQLKSIKGKVEAAYQKMIALIGNASFSEIEMETIWTVTQACIAPIITYGGEIMEKLAINYKKTNMIMDNIMKRTLKLPKATPREALYIETGLLDPETIIKKNRISMEWRIKNGDNQTMKEILALQHKGCWAEQNKQLKKEMDIPDEIISQTQYTMKNTVQEKAKTTMKQKLEQSGNEKSKIKYYFEGKKEWKIGQRAKYMDKLTRNQASTIFKARTRMLKTKGNYKNAHKDQKCRLCGKEEETQSHILEDCLGIDEPILKITKEMIFKEDIEHLRKITLAITKRMEILEAVKSTAL